MAKKRSIKDEIVGSAGLIVVGLFFLGSGALTYSNTQAISQNSQQVTHTFDVITSMDALLSVLKDAETSQRGYVLTGESTYLEPYYEATSRYEDVMVRLENLTRDNPKQQQRIEALRRHVTKKMSELATTVTIRKSEGLEPALKIIKNDLGKREMDAIREIVEDMRSEEYSLRAQRIASMDRAFDLAIASGFAVTVMGLVLISIIGTLISRAARVRRNEEWLRAGQVGLAASIAGDPTVEKLADKVLKFLSEYLDTHAGAMYVNRDGSLQRAATYGVPRIGMIPDTVQYGEGLLGQAAKEGKTFMVHDVPAGYLTFASTLTEGTPLQLAIAPAIVDGSTKAVFELGFIHRMPPLTEELLKRIGEPLAIAFRSAMYREDLKELLEETQRQAEELQSQSEELRVNNEELGEQSRALRESQVRLEQQQAEMEQTNAQLEEQTQLLELQKDDLEQARDAVAAKANELERASQYKSDFLANMSHELRTPLNSSLILAKLLADNPQGNLTEEQVIFAQTIQSSGNDLLVLINDILDLSKIEAGQMHVNPETVSLTALTQDLERVFGPVAKQRGLNLSTSLDKACPKTIDTDRQRLEQILRNLLSNAIKFTEKGTIALNISLRPEKLVAFEVRDTGIGIPASHQSLIFEAFQQADSTISRKYGGTGLGLSITRELTRLLGGSIQMSSVEGKGSVFTLLLPLEYSEQEAQASRLSSYAAAPVQHPAPEKPPKKKAAKPRVTDDRETLSGDSRVLLIVEDDANFARILCELSRELDFKCLVSNTAEDAIMLARQYMPQAVLLDIGLPDHSGLFVLDRLKHDPRTRHIPVHVVSAKDHTQTALQLGAVGAIIKPVKREELVSALQQMETRITKRLRKVLIVEDDTVQRESMNKLLGSKDVKTVAVGTAAECFEQLKAETFDCMVLDLSLPDATGFSLLEKLSKESECAFPPVIVYTGRALTEKEEQQLRRYSKSIIIKGAKSPERLLDEVTLFLHQVVADLPDEQQKMLEKAKSRDELLDGRHILIVEDDVRNIYALTSILEPHGTVIHIARNGREALDLLQKNQPIDLILMDVMMPEMDGITATQHIRKEDRHKRLPIIMLTAKAMPDDQERCLRAGANDYMAKPLDVEKLLSLVRVWMPR